MRKEALDCIEEMVSKNPKVCIIGSDLGSGTFAKSLESHPDRVLMEGIAEQHIIGFSAGLAANGFYPIIHTIATFLTRRCYEQIAIDLAQQKLPALLVGAGGGLVYAPLGPTHQATDDFALMTNIPGMRIFAPADPREVIEIIEACVQNRILGYIRLGRGGEPIVTDQMSRIDGSLSKILGSKGLYTIICTGTLLHEALQARCKLNEVGISGQVVHFPELSESDIRSTFNSSDISEKLFIIEEHIPVGGLATRVREVLGFGSETWVRQLPSSYSENYGSQKDHWLKWGLTADQISSWIRGQL